MKLRRLKFVVCCGHGMGTVFLMKMMVEEILRDEGVEADVIPADILTVAGYTDADAIVCAADFAVNVQNIEKPKVLIEDLIDKEANRKIIKDLLKEMGIKD